MENYINSLNDITYQPELIPGIEDAGDRVYSR